MQKRDILIRIRQEEELAAQRIAAAREERDRTVEAARVQAASLLDALEQDCARHYREALEAASRTMTPDEAAYAATDEQRIDAAMEAAQSRMDDVVETMFKTFVGYVDAKAEEDE
ncbi:MAG: hypothetical protein PHW58_03370 [Candidatus Methanofastidiosa archaeon]|nr:hypothetical protein [Candidatus Methanofastidiosa archaeon]